MTAGETTYSSGAGGEVVITGGKGANTVGGIGGNVAITGGSGRGAVSGLFGSVCLFGLVLLRFLCCYWQCCLFRFLFLFCVYFISHFSPLIHTQPQPHPHRSPRRQKAATST